MRGHATNRQGLGQGGSSDMTNEDPKGPPTVGRRKPVRLEVQIELVSEPSHAVDASAGDQRHKAAPRRASGGPSALAPAPGFDARMRYEKKGRGGQPVIVLYAVRSEALARATCKDADDLGRKLRGMLGCGGTVTDGAIILQIRDKVRLEEALGRLGLKVQASGGF